MTPALALGLIVRPALSLLATYDVRWNHLAERMVLAIGYQESGFRARRQAENGPARSFWQFERAGVSAVLTHRASVTAAKDICAALVVPPTADAVHAAIEHNDLLAAGFARLLLWTDPEPLPTGEDEAWRYYLRTWRPGKPAPDRWQASWQAAEVALEMRDA